MPSQDELRDEQARNMKREELLVRKFTIPCTIMTTAGEIEGNLHRRGENRIIDELNTTNRFIAVTDVTIQPKKSGKASTAKELGFLVLRADQIVWVRPIEDQDLEKAQVQTSGTE